MTFTSITNSLDKSENAASAESLLWIRAISDGWKWYSGALVIGLVVLVMAGLFTSSVWPVIAVALLLLVGGIGFHARLSQQNFEARQDISVLERRLALDASSSRVLAGVRMLGSNDSRSPDARLAAAARMATEYPACVIFNLRDAHGVLVPSNWSYDGHLSHIREEFEAIDSNSPGAIAARQGSAIVMSSTLDDGCLELPQWAEQAGFTQGIVAAISRGLDTIGVVYVLNKSDVLPTLKEIEQLELIIGFRSVGSSAGQSELSSVQNQPFRVVEKSALESRTASTAPIRMAGFALNPKLERMEMDGVLISLSPTEFLLMHTLASSPDRPVSPVELMDRCWTRDARPADNAVDVAI
ncbi:MAG: winged helix-turn-helix domain-containing protein, partial [Dehalococcoidia bacterium]